MHDLWTLTLAAIGGASAWFLTSFVGGPIRRFYDLRREVNRCLVEYGNVLARRRQRRLSDDDGVPNFEHFTMANYLPTGS
jgi:hypothetical protein